MWIKFDETTNSESKKEIRIRFWYENMNQVVERHLKTFP